MNTIPDNFAHEFGHQFDFGQPETMHCGWLNYLNNEKCILNDERTKESRENDLAEFCRFHLLDGFGPARPSIRDIGDPR